MQVGPGKLINQSGSHSNAPKCIFVFKFAFSTGERRRGKEIKLDEYAKWKTMRMKVA